MMKIADLLEGIETINISGSLDVEISGISYDSRKVKNGDCFMAISGYKDDGNKYITNAIESGAKLIISEMGNNIGSTDISWVRLKDIRKAFAQISMNFYKNPLKDKYVVGVTGTNGKSTVIAIIESIFSKRMDTVKIGTLGFWCGRKGRNTSLTTPEACEIYEFLTKECRGNFENVVMEVSSVALELKRVEGIEFSQAIFTNFSGDHLDFHNDMDNYFDSKLELFRSLSSDKWAIINIDDERSKLIIEAINSKCITFGFSEEADVKPITYKLSADGINAIISTPAGNLKIESQLVGRVNLQNILAAIASSIVKNIGFDEISAALKDFKAVKGRIDTIYKNNFNVIIDYAHTDNALENLLGSIKELNFRKIILVFGAGGSRDTTKRPRMGAVAACYADEIIVTSDNPRDEDPELIIKQIVAGFPKNFNSYQIEIDRKKGIALAMKKAGKGDIVIIAGKGHEDYQIIGSKTIHFDDYEIVRNYIGGKDA